MNQVSSLCSVPNHAHGHEGTHKCSRALSGTEIIIWNKSAKEAGYLFLKSVEGQIKVTTSSINKDQTEVSLMRLSVIGQLSLLLGACLS